MATEEELLVPCSNFSMVSDGIFRSGYPTKKNHSFLLSLGLRSVVFLCPETYPEATKDFYKEQGILLFQVPMEGNKEPFIDISPSDVHRVLSILCDTAFHPVLVHCNKGKHRTGAVIGCLRRIQGWALSSTFDEYCRFAGDKARALDQQCIELYEPRIVCAVPERLPWWLHRRDAVSQVSSEEALAVVSDPPTSATEEKPKKEKKDKKEKSSETPS